MFLKTVFGDANTLCTIKLCIKLSCNRKEFNIKMYRNIYMFDAAFQVCTLNAFPANLFTAYFMKTHSREVQFLCNASFHFALDVKHVYKLINSTLESYSYSSLQKEIWRFKWNSWSSAARILKKIPRNGDHILETPGGFQMYPFFSTWFSL